MTETTQTFTDFSDAGLKSEINEISAKNRDETIKKYFFTAATFFAGAGIGLNLFNPIVATFSAGVMMTSSAFASAAFESAKEAHTQKIRLQNFKSMVDKAKSQDPEIEKQLAYLLAANKANEASNEKDNGNRKIFALGTDISSTEQLRSTLKSGDAYWTAYAYERTMAATHGDLPTDERAQANFLQEKLSERFPEGDNPSYGRASQSMGSKGPATDLSLSSPAR